MHAHVKRWAAIAALVLLLLLDAPVARSDGARRGSPASPPRRTNLRLEDCSQQIGVFPMDALEVRDLLPEGFDPIAFQDSSPAGPTGAPAPPAASATLQLTVTTCARPLDVSLAQIWIYVQPPEEWRAEVDAYLIVPWLATSTDELTAGLRRFGLPATTGQVSNDLGRADSPLRVGEVRVAAGGVRMTLSTRVPAVLEETTAERLRLFGVRARQVTGVVDFVEDPHTHLMLGAASLAVDGGEPIFPAPRLPGVSLHVEPGYGLHWEPVARTSGVERKHRPAPYAPAPSPAAGSPREVASRLLPQVG